MDPRVVTRRTPAARWLFAYISGSTFVFQDVFGLSATRYSLVFGANALATGAVALVALSRPFRGRERGRAPGRSE